jgi:RNA polymerase sigma-70 factor (ECF subfamily)
MNATKEIDIEDLYQRYGPMVIRRCRQLLGDENEALDAMQDVFVQLLTHKDRMKVEYSSSLLYRIATNLSLNKIRSRSRRPETPGEEFLQQVADLDELEPKLEARSVLATLFGRHPESTKTMAVLHYQDGMTLEEVALEVGMSVSGVRKRLRNLRGSLRGVLEDT